MRAIMVVDFDTVDATSYESLRLVRDAVNEQLCVAMAEHRPKVWVAIKEPAQRVLKLIDEIMDELDPNDYS